MKFCGCISVDCSQCLQYSVKYCPPSLINIPTTNLISGNDYYLWIVDKLGNAFVDAITGNADGSFTINKSNFPIGMFNVDFGKMDVFITSDSYGRDIVPVSYGGVNYNCIMLGVNKPEALADSCLVLSSNGTILLNG